MDPNLVSMGALIGGGVYLWYQNEISGQQDRNAFLSAEIKKLEGEQKQLSTRLEELLPEWETAESELEELNAGTPVG